MTRIRSAALCAALMLGVAAAAQAQTQTAPLPQRRPHVAADTGARARKARQRLFRGVQLTAAQQAQLRAVRDRYAPTRQQLRASMRPVLQQTRAARQRGDTAAARAALQGVGSQRAQLRALQARERAELRTVLTPAQQATLDRNIATARARRGRHAQRSRPEMRRGRRAPLDSTAASPGTI